MVEKTILIDLKKILKKLFKKRNFYVIIEYVNSVVKSGAKWSKITK